MFIYINDNDSILPFSVEIQGKGGGEPIDCINIRIVLKRKQGFVMFFVIFNSFSTNSFL